MSNTRRTEMYIEAMALSMIVEEMMNEGTETTVVWANDGSAIKIVLNRCSDLLKKADPKKQVI